jgi:hypothetical protein
MRWRSARPPAPFGLSSATTCWPLAAAAAVEQSEQLHSLGYDMAGDEVPPVAASSAPSSASWPRSCSNPAPSSPCHPAQLVELPLPRPHLRRSYSENISSSRPTICSWISIGIFLSRFATPVTGAPSHAVGVAAIRSVCPSAHTGPRAVPICRSGTIPCICRPGYRHKCSSHFSRSASRQIPRP